MPRKENELKTKRKAKPAKKAAKPAAKAKGAVREKVVAGRGKAFVRSKAALARAKVKAVAAKGLGKAEPTESEVDNVFGNIIKAGIRRNGIKTVSRSEIMKNLGR